jgi:hypothetical protein
MKLKHIIISGISAALIILPASGSIALGSSQPDTKSSVPVSVAKSKIRNLYYGLQQSAAASSRTAYILSHNYPGMYSDPKSCIAFWPYLWMNIQPDLSSVEPDPSWRIPSGVYKNKLVNKRPSGDTFVFSVNGNQFLHSTILNGKTYFFMWLCNR